MSRAIGKAQEETYGCQVLAECVTACFAKLLDIARMLKRTQHASAVLEATSSQVMCVETEISFGLTTLLSFKRVTCWMIGSKDSFDSQDAESFPQFIKVTECA